MLVVIKVSKSGPFLHSFHPSIHTNALIVVLLKLRIENNGYLSLSSGCSW